MSAAVSIVVTHSAERATLTISARDARGISYASVTLPLALAAVTIASLQCEASALIDDMIALELARSQHVAGHALSERLGDAPIEPRLKELMNSLARGVDEILNGKDGAKQNGFVLLVFPFEGRDGRCNYISNAQRAEVVTLLKEQLARFEGQPELSGKA